MSDISQTLSKSEERTTPNTALAILPSDVLTSTLVLLFNSVLILIFCFSITATSPILLCYPASHLLIQCLLKEC